MSAPASGRSEGRRNHPGHIRVARGKTGPGLGHVALVAADGTIAVGEQVFRLADLDRITYRAATRINYASYLIGVGEGNRQRTFTFDAYRRGTQLDDAHEIWLSLVTLLESTACPRIAEAALQTIAGGGSVT